MIHALTNFSAAATQYCTLEGGSFLGFPTWYKYLKGVEVSVDTSTQCVVKITHLNDVWLIVAAILELLLRIGALIAIGMVIAGGVMYITSEGKPDKLSKALKTIINAAVGLAIAIASAATVAFIAGRFN